jgi:hypothetical protein
MACKWYGHFSLLQLRSPGRDKVGYLFGNSLGRGTKIWLAASVSDMRRGFDGLSAKVRINNNTSEREMQRVVLNRKNSPVRRKSARRENSRNPGQPHQHLPSGCHRSATLSQPTADQSSHANRQPTTQVTVGSVEAASANTPFQP